MVKSFVLDSMHLLSAGAMKKLLVEYWLTGTLNVRLGRRQKDEVNRRIASLKVQIPCDFQRTPRSTLYAQKWKCTEFRLFLLYIGPIVMKNIVGDHIYKHFLLLHVASRIMNSNELAETYNNNAKMYLHSFFSALPILYGPSSQTLNMHNLTHVADDTKTMKCTLSCIDAFPFENLLGGNKTINTYTKTVRWHKYVVAGIN